MAKRTSRGVLCSVALERKDTDMNIQITLSGKDIKRLVVEELQKKLGDIPLVEENVKIETRSKQNYKSEWEIACYRVIYNHITL